MEKIRRKLRALFAIALMLGVWLPTYAYDFKVGSYYYNYINKTAKTVEVAGGSNSGSANIPQTVTYSGVTYSVTSIGESAFKGYSGLTSVTIPNSVTKIGNSAFYNCRGLTSVTIPNSVTEIGDNAFYNCSGLTSVSIPPLVTSINNCTFGNCSGLTSVTIGPSVTSINYCAFFGCDNLKDVVFYGSSVSIGYEAFYDTKINLIFFRGEIKSINEYAFYGCSPTIYSLPSEVETFREKFPKYTVKEITVEQIKKYTNPEDGANEYDEEKSGVVSFSGSGSGTESDPFLIFNPVQLNDVRNSVGHSGVYYKLMSDIDMTEWIAENNLTMTDFTSHLICCFTKLLHTK